MAIWLLFVWPILFSIYFSSIKFDNELSEKRRELTLENLDLLFFILKGLAAAFFTVVFGIIIFARMRNDTLNFVLLVFYCLYFFVFGTIIVYLKSGDLIDQHFELIDLAYSEEMTKEHLTESSFMIGCQWISLFFPVFIRVLFFM
jgi:hypothetical protein